MADEYDETPLPLSERLRLHWWHFLNLFHRCRECGHRPDGHRDRIGPRWEDDKIAQVLGIGQYGCRRCGHGSIEERDRSTTPEQENS